VAELTEGPPDSLVDAERVRVLHEGREKQLERFVCMTPGGEVARELFARAGQR
jgi:hypothetical protein